MNVNSLITMNYENKTAFRRGKNKPNSNPIKPNFRKAKMNLKSLAGKSGHNHLLDVLRFFGRTSGTKLLK